MSMAKYEGNKIWGVYSSQFKGLLKDFEHTAADWGNYLRRYWDVNDGFRVDDYTNWPHVRAITTAEFDRGKRITAMPQRGPFWTSLPTRYLDFPKKAEAFDESWRISSPHLGAQRDNNWRVPYVWRDEDGVKRVHMRHPEEIDDRMAVLELGKWYYINFLSEKKMPSDFENVDKRGIPPLWVRDAHGKRLSLDGGHESHYLIRFRDSHFGGHNENAHGREVDEISHGSNDKNVSDYLSLGEATRFKEGKSDEDLEDLFYQTDHIIDLDPKSMSQVIVGDGNIQVGGNLTIDGKNVDFDGGFDNPLMPLWFWNGKLDAIELPQRPGAEITAESVRLKHNESFEFSDGPLLFGLITRAIEGLINYPLSGGFYGD